MIVPRQRSGRDHRSNRRWQRARTSGCQPDARRGGSYMIMHAPTVALVNSSIKIMLPVLRLRL